MRWLIVSYREAQNFQRMKEPSDNQASSAGKLN